MSDKNEEYILGSSESEIERLAYQNEVWFDATFDLWNSAEISYGESVVDLGCGPGFCTFPLSRLVGSDGHIFAVDSSDKFASLLKEKIKVNNTKNISFHKNNANNLSLEDSSADAVFARWLFCFLENPSQVLAEIKRVLKPKGRLIIIDYFNYRAANVFPNNDALSELFKAYLQIVTAHKGSYDIGEILPELIVENGLEIASLTPICRIARPNTRIWKWVELFNEVSVPALVEQGIWNEKQKEDFEKEWKNAKNNPAAFFFAPPMIGIIAKKS
ncbi:MAG: class I SAM-dependent methyltransferase [Aridibacter sp.]